MTELVRDFVERCEEFGRSVYGLESSPKLGMEYGIEATFRQKDNKIVVPNEFRRSNLTSYGKHVIAHEVSECLDHHKSHIVSDGIDGKEKSMENLSDIEWSNYLINVGIREGKSESGCDRILSVMGEDIALKKHKKAILWAQSEWSKNYCSERHAEIVLNFSEKTKSKSTSDMVKWTNAFNRFMNDDSKTEDEKDNMLWSFFPHIAGPDMTHVIVSLFPTPYTYSAYNSLQRLDNNGFQRFVAEWKPRNLNEEIHGIDPLYYFLKQSPSIPKEHEKAIEDEISSIMLSPSVSGIEHQMCRGPDLNLRSN